MEIEWICVYWPFSSVTLINLFISFFPFFGIFHKVFLCLPITPLKKYSFTTSFPIWMLSCSTPYAPDWGFQNNAEWKRWEQTYLLQPQEKSTKWCTISKEGHTHADWGLWLEHFSEEYSSTHYSPSSAPSPNSHSFNVQVILTPFQHPPTS